MTHAINPDMRVVASPGLLAQGCVNVISLEEIKSQTGQRWDRLKKSVWDYLEKLLRQRLASSDFYIQLDETTFVLCCPSASENEAQIFCLRVAHELHKAMLGDCQLNGIKIGRVVNSAEDVIDIVPIGGEALARLAQQAGLNGREVESPVVQALRKGSSAKVIFSHKFSPIWDSQKEAITTYRCTSKSSVDEMEAISTSARLKSAIATALAGVRLAADLLLGRMELGDRFIAWIPISYELISSPVARMEITNACRSLPGELRPYFIFEITSLPHGVPQSRLSELAGTLRAFCRGVMVQLPARTANYRAYDGIGLYGIGLCLSAADATDTEMGSEIFNLCIAAKKQNIVSYILDLPNNALIGQVCGFGANLMSSSVIGDPTEQPGSIKRLSLADIVKRAV
jgi:hypothetical protein